MKFEVKNFDLKKFMAGDKKNEIEIEVIEVTEEYLKKSLQSPRIH